MGEKTSVLEQASRRGVVPVEHVMILRYTKEGMVIPGDLQVETRDGRLRTAISKASVVKGIRVFSAGEGRGVGVETLGLAIAHRHLQGVGGEGDPGLQCWRRAGGRSGDSRVGDCAPPSPRRRW